MRNEYGIKQELSFHELPAENQIVMLIKGNQRLITENDDLHDLLEVAKDEIRQLRHKVRKNSRSNQQVQQLVSVKKFLKQHDLYEKYLAQKLGDKQLVVEEFK